MLEENKEIAVETVFAIPRNQFYWSYQINEGAVHTEPKENIFEFLKEFIPSSKYSKLIDLIARMRPLLILVREERVIELAKKDVDLSYLRQNIEDEIAWVLNNYNSFSKPDSLDEKLKTFQKKVLKF